jgi:hypothetical protein
MDQSNSNARIESVQLLYGFAFQQHRGRVHRFSVKDAKREPKHRNRLISLDLGVLS